MLFLVLCRITCPLLTTRSSHPSESTSTNAVPNPTNARPTTASPAAGVANVKCNAAARHLPVPVQGVELVLVVGHPERRAARCRRSRPRPPPCCRWACRCRRGPRPTPAPRSSNRKLARGAAVEVQEVVGGVVGHVDVGSPVPVDVDEAARRAPCRSRGPAGRSAARPPPSRPRTCRRRGCGTGRAGGTRTSPAGRRRARMPG